MNRENIEESDANPTDKPRLKKEYLHGTAYIPDEPQSEFTPEMIEQIRARIDMQKEIAAMGPSQNNYIDENDFQDSKLRPKLEFFGTDLATVPCFRSTCLYGLMSGFGSGLTYFAFTSKPVAAQKVCIFTMFGVTVGYWMICRYSYSLQKFQSQQKSYRFAKLSQNMGTPLAEPIPEVAKLQNVNLDSPKDDEFFKKFSKPTS